MVGKILICKVQETILCSVSTETKKTVQPEASLNSSVYSHTKKWMNYVCNFLPSNSIFYFFCFLEWRLKTQPQVNSNFFLSYLHSDKNILLQEKQSKKAYRREIRGFIIRILHPTWCLIAPVSEICTLEEILSTLKIV